MPRRRPSTTPRTSPGWPLLDLDVMAAFSGSGGPSATVADGRSPARALIRSYRRRGLVTRRELAASCGVSERLVGKWESGACQVPRRLVGKVCRSLMLTASERAGLCGAVERDRESSGSRGRATKAAAASRRDHTYCGAVPDRVLPAILETYRRHGRYRALLHRARTALLDAGVLAVDRSGPSPRYSVAEGGREASESLDPGSPAGRYLSRIPLEALESGPRAPYGSASGFRKAMETIADE